MKRDLGLAGVFARRVRLFEGVDPSVLGTLAAACRQRACAGGEFLCHAGEPVRDVWALLEGRVGVHRCLWKGGRVGIEIMVPGDAFGLPALSLWSYPSDIQATRASVVAAIPRRALLEAMRNEPRLAQNLLTIMAQRVDFVESQLSLAQEPVERRLAAALVYLRRKFGPVVPLTSAEIAELAGTTPETAMRKLKVLEREGVLGRKRGCVIIPDEARLSARLGA